MIETISICIFLLGYILISGEHILKISKTSISLVVGVILWGLVVLSGSGHVRPALAESGSEIFSLIIFLLSAMTLVEILTHYGFFDFVYHQLIRLKLQDKSQFFIITLLAFIFSSFLDNLTTTIVMIQIARRFFGGDNLLKVGAAIVIAANAGGAFSPIGDITTTMLWLADKFTAQTILIKAFLPSLTVFLVSTLWIGRSIVPDATNTVEEVKKLGKTEWLIISLCLAAFSFPLLMTTLGLPPYLGLLFGLGLVWLVVDVLRITDSSNTRLIESIETFFQKTNISSLYFFIGILIAIGALRHLGILDELSHAIFTTTPSTDRLILGSVAIGLLSAVFDNIPLTAAAIDIVKTTESSIWVLVALTVGTGGSLLVIGSAPGIIAMTMIKELTFAKYLKIATIPVFAAFSLGILVWYVQFLLFH